MKIYSHIYFNEELNFVTQRIIKPSFSTFLSVLSKEQSDDFLSILFVTGFRNRSQNMLSKVVFNMKFHVNVVFDLACYPLYMLTSKR